MRMVRGSFSPEEAAAIAGVPERFIKHGIEVVAARPKAKRVGKVACFVLSDRDVYDFAAVNKLDFDLKLGDYRDFPLRFQEPEGSWTFGRWIGTALS